MVVATLIIHLIQTVSTSDSDEEVFCALKDIKKGDEIVEDYTQYWVKNEPRFKDFMKEKQSISLWVFGKGDFIKIEGE